MTIDRLDEFHKDVKSLLKKYRTLNNDLEVVSKVLEVTPDSNTGRGSETATCPVKVSEVAPNSNPPFSFRISDLGITTCVIKVKKIASRSFKGKGVNSGLRLIYAYFEKEEKIILIEIYHKNDKLIEDRERILRHFQ